MNASLLPEQTSPQSIIVDLRNSSFQQDWVSSNSAWTPRLSPTVPNEWTWSLRTNFYQVYQPAQWFRRARSLSPGAHHTSLIFKDSTGAPWTSLFFRQQFLYPVLRRLKNDGDLPPIRIDIVTAFWSLHCYRRDAHTHVSFRLPGRRTKASKEMLYEHGRWRYNTWNLPINAMYLRWSYKDRIQLTRLLM